ncbi:MAG TPA: GMC family oxidoreductase [Thermoanaerobaculia bacterium]|nr:GMC family oxidoreductase [Thermoanaerobaculia bacterium]
MAEQASVTAVFDYDYVVVGSGFGGSVAALRLAEKGYRVLVVEAGKRWRTEDFPRTNWNLRKFLWLPALFCYGIQRLTLLRDTLVLSGAGVGGGSLVYAGTLLTPTETAFRRGGWPHGVDWPALLAPHYETARRMLGVTENPRLWEGDRLLLDFARGLGREDTFRPTTVGMLFGDRPGQAAGDPYFGGEGPERATCTQCGGCMVGCRHNAKNTLDKNYLWFAEKLGAEVLPETKATRVEPLAGPGGHGPGYRLRLESTTRKLRKRRRPVTARGVVFAAGALGTVDLLLRSREAGALPRLSPALGRFVRTNSEVLCGFTARSGAVDYSKGLAITSGFHPSDDTYMEVVRYPSGSDAMGLLGTILTDDGTRLTRPLRWLGNCARHPVDFLRTFKLTGWARRSTILLVMQTLDSSLALVRARRWFWPFRKALTSRAEPGQSPVPTFIPIANQAARTLAATIDAFPSSAINEVLLNVPTTAHLMGGATMGSTPDEGVVDAANRVFGYDELYVVDGAAIPANLGVNPSLTITALAEHAMSRVPPKNPARGLLPLPVQARAAGIVLQEPAAARTA